MTAKEKSILDVISYAEGTLGVSQDGYDVIVSFKRIIGWTQNTDIVHGHSKWYQEKLDSTAAGRYQFNYDTWLDMNGKKNAAFTKNNQDLACIKLINQQLKSTLIDKRSVTIEDLDKRENFDIFLQKCASRWASLPLTKDVTYKGVLRKANKRWDGSDTKEKTATRLFEIYNKAYDIYKKK